MIATKNSERKLVATEIAEQEELLAEWKHKRDPEPPSVKEETKVARRELEESVFAYLPLYEAIEFQEHVSDDIRVKIESALIDSGLLNAMITEEDVPVKHDRIIQVNPQMMAHTLADYVQPDVEADA